MNRLRGLALAVKLGVSFLFFSGLPAWAQCSMCRTALDSQGPGAAGAVNKGIVLLLFPAVALFSATFLVAFRGLIPADSDGEPEKVAEWSALGGNDVARDRG